MTRRQFESKAVREAERLLGIPPGWWGTWGNIYGPGGRRVRFSGRWWTVRVGKTLVGKYSGRSFAISKARKYGSTLR